MTCLQNIPDKGVKSEVGKCKRPAVEYASEIRLVGHSTISSRFSQTTCDSLGLAVVRVGAEENFGLDRISNPAYRHSLQFHQHRRIKPRIILLNIPGPILLAKLLNHSLHRLGTSHRHSSKLRFRASRINSNRRILEHVLVPLRLRSRHRQQVELVALHHTPHRNRNLPPRLLPNHADRDLLVPAESILKTVLRSCHRNPPLPHSKPFYDRPLPLKLICEWASKRGTACTAVEDRLFSAA